MVGAAEQGRSWLPSFGLFNRGGAAPAEPSRGAAPTRVAQAVPTAPRQSQPTFAPNSLAPQPSVAIPAATSPAGELPPPQPQARRFGSRIARAAISTREALRIRPREVSAPDPVRLSSHPVKVEAPVFVSAARVYEGQGRMDQAREQYEKALAADAKNLDALVGLARLQHREGNLAAATDMYQKALKHHPDNTIVLNDLGLCYARRGMLPQAQESLEKAVRKDPASKLYRNNLALVLVESGRNEDALRHLTAAHGEATAHYNLGFMLREKGRHEQSVYHLQTALRLNPQMMPARQMLAQLEPQPAPQVHAGSMNPQLGAPQWQGAPVETPDTARRQQWPASYQTEQGAEYQGQPVEMSVGDRGQQQPPAVPTRIPAESPQLQPQSQPQYQPRPSWGAAPTPGDMPAYMRGR
jgi:tetratricopeptide (TPR) repeat protein